VVFSGVRSLDLLLWLGKKYHDEDIKEYVSNIKRNLDIMVDEFEIECGIKERPAPVIQPKPNFDELTQFLKHSLQSPETNSKDIQSPDQT